MRIDDESPVTDELVDYINRAHTSLRLPSLGHAAARGRNRSLAPASTLRIVSVAIEIPSRPSGTKAGAPHGIPALWVEVRRRDQMHRRRNAFQSASQRFRRSMLIRIGRKIRAGFVRVSNRTSLSRLA
jgi:hypothetical protein